MHRDIFVKHTFTCCSMLFHVSQHPQSCFSTPQFICVKTMSIFFWMLLIRLTTNKTNEWNVWRSRKTKVHGSKTASPSSRPRVCAGTPQPGLQWRLQWRRRTTNDAANFTRTTAHAYRVERDQHVHTKPTGFPALPTRTGCAHVQHAGEKGPSVSVQ